MITKDCSTCKRSFKTYPCYIDTKKYCSKKCMYIGQKGRKFSQEHKDKIGKANKGNVSWIVGKHHTEEAKRKIGIAHKGKRLSEEHIRKLQKSHLKKGRYKMRGYVFIYKPSHPFARGKYVPEHRLIIEKYIGRYLSRKEIIHHKNGIKDDNRIKNLVLTVKGKNWHPRLCPKCGFEFQIF